MNGICGVILAAGESTRMGRDKALLPWPRPSSPESSSAVVPSSRTLLSAGIRALSPHSDLVLVVAGKNADNVAPVIYAEGAFLVFNQLPERGQFSSLQTGLRDVLDRGRDMAIVTLVDHPPVGRETLDALVMAFSRREHGIWAVVPEYQGRHGHPILIGREMIEAFLQATATSNAREVEHANIQHIEYLPTSDALILLNLDSPEDYSSVQFPGKDDT